IHSLPPLSRNRFSATTGAFRRPRLRFMMRGMLLTTHVERRRLEGLDRASLRALQLEKLNRLLQQILPHNRFYAEKLNDLKLPLSSLDELTALPFTFKQELALDLPSHEFAANLTYP